MDFEEERNSHLWVGGGSDTYIANIDIVLLRKRNQAKKVRVDLNTLIKTVTDDLARREIQIFHLGA